MKKSYKRLKKDIYGSFKIFKYSIYIYGIFQEKHEHQQKTLTLKLETEQRDAREADLREVGGKLNTVTKEKNDCEEQLNAKDEELGVRNSIVLSYLN